VSRSSLSRLFAPRTIAVVGASPTAGKAGNALMHSLAAFPGDVHPVHPTAEEVLGRPAYGDVRAIPHAVDLALLAVPAGVTPRAVAQCVEAGVGGIVVHAGGFAESGDDGVALQEATAAALDGSPTRLLGPNTSGFLAPPLGLCASFVASAQAISSGPLAIVAQSGGVNHALAFAAAAEGLGVHLAVGLGNAADVGFADVLDHLALDDEVGVVALAIEGLSEGRAVVAAIERLADRVPVVALKVGRTDVNAFAQSHTGALTGSYAVTRSALRQAGAVVVDDTTALLDAARALVARRLRPNASPGVAVVTGQAGPGLLLADALASAGAHAPELPVAVQDDLRRLLGDLTYLRNPVDTGRPGASFRAVLDVVAAADGIDATAVYLLDEPDAIDTRAVLGAPSPGPVVLGTAGRSRDVVALRDDLARSGVAVLPSPERAAAAIAAVVRDAQAAHARTTGAPVVDELGGRGIEGPWDEGRAKALLDAVGITTPRRAICDGPQDALFAAQEIGYPVVAKLVHPELLHKTEYGAVHVGLRDAAELRVALNALTALPFAATGALLVEAMASPGPELILGATRDAVFGPIVMLGAGGVEAELIQDTATRLAPLSEHQAAQLLGELRLAGRYRGHRGAPAVDEQQLAGLIARLGALLVARADIAEIEINPLRVTRNGLIALDALVIAS
jgi:acetyltransferase